MYRRFIKRLFDIMLSGAGLFILSPVYLILAILVRTKLGSPILFRQERPGLHEKIFTLKKFRTMTDKRDEQGSLLPDHERLTSFGKFLRATSLDELPELWNIFVGDMSLIGPRPLLVSYLPYYTERERQRHSVRPGLTGLAQVSGRNYLSWDKRFEKDVEYVEHITFLNDCKILLKTVQVALTPSNVAEDTNQAEGNFAEIRKAQMAQAEEDPKTDKDQRG
ncbi:MAG: sugar transferase [Lachnospiraceae bacterium]|nr:sugar transferase [Lachnospiraceae bacterium]